MEASLQSLHEKSPEAVEKTRKLDRICCPARLMPQLPPLPGSQDISGPLISPQDVAMDEK